MIHLQGFGLVGAQLAHLFHAQGRTFTWSDTEEEFVAWHASTGCIYPSKDNDIERWEWLLEEVPAFAKYTERGRWCHASKTPPEGAKLNTLAHAGPLQISDGTTIQVNVQKLVTDTRKQFESRRRDGPRSKDQIIVTHGSATAHHYVWGWSALVLLDIDPLLSTELTLFRKVLRPAIYLRKNYDLAYLYPQPKTQWFYGGTSTVVQKTPKHKELDALFDRWMTLVDERTDGIVTVTDLKKGSLTEGWRPRPNIAQHSIAWEDEGVIYVRAQGGSGLRHFPRVAEAVTALL